MEVTPVAPMELTPVAPKEVTPETPMEVTPVAPIEVTPETLAEVTVTRIEIHVPFLERAPEIKTLRENWRLIVYAYARLED